MATIHTNTATKTKKPRQTTQSLYIPEALLTIGIVREVTGFSEPTIRRRVAEGKFPAPIKFGERCTRWRAETVLNWLKAQQPVREEVQQ